ncbi:unnamed protein product [Pieris macdunnoughi]|uniref:Uncharacterized protein n=1 Tax=Pieris macdunnoughi TaxID=345717 RepID=A0A821R2L0_9NEOP|nr:unnamed protein product [Pieris macdunnoughi]
MSTLSATAESVDEAAPNSDEFQTADRKKKRSANGGPPAKGPIKPSNLYLKGIYLCFLITVQPVTSET